MDHAHFVPMHMRPKLTYYSEGHSMGDQLPPWQMLVLSKLVRVYENFDDDEDTDVGREWLEALTLMGLLRKVKRGRWGVTEEGNAVVRAILEPSEESVQCVTEKALLRQQEQASLEKIHAARDQALREAGVPESMIAPGLCVASGEWPHNCTCPAHREAYEASYEANVAELIEAAQYAEALLTTLANSGRVSGDTLPKLRAALKAVSP